MPVVVALLLALVMGPLAVASPASAAPADGAGHVDFSYGGPKGADDVTANHSQNKLWYHDGSWWALMLDPDDDAWQIFRLDMASQTWTDTNVTIDERTRAHGDVLSAGSKLYVASPHTRDEAVQVYRYSYDAVNQTYILDDGFPATTDAVGVRFATIAQDSTGQLWTVFTVSGRVKYITSTDDGLTWSPSADLPEQGGDLIAGGPTEKRESDDVVAVVAFGGNRIGVLWSNSSATEDAFYFAVHEDSAGDDAWTRETALGGPGSSAADNHVSLKAAPDGRVIAAVKTGFDELSGSDDEPLIAVLERGTDGTWAEPRNVSNVDQDGTRPILVLDTAQANVFIVDQVGGGAVHRRTAPLGSLDFGSPAIGEAFIKSSEHPTINDPTSTSQTVPAGSGLVVLASDIGTTTYLHGCAGDPCTTTPPPPPPPAADADFTADVVTGQAPLTVGFSDASSGEPTAWSWDFGDDSEASTEEDPTHTYQEAGTFTVELTITTATGSDVETKRDFITVDPAAKTATSTTLAAAPNPSTSGEDVTFTATVSGEDDGTPTGSVTFRDGNESLGTATLDGSGAATLTTAELDVGTHSITAVYGGSDDFAGSTSAALEQTVEAESLPPCPLTRLSGPTRFATSVEIGKVRFPEATQAVIVSAEPDRLTDGVVAAPFAQDRGAPILLTRHGALPDVVKDDLEDRNVTDVWVIGGPLAIDPDVHDELRAMDITVDLIAGDTRYDTAAMVADRMLDGSSTAFVASGDNYHLIDALVAGGPAAANDWPVLLTRKDGVPDATLEMLDELAVSKTYVVGGPVPIDEAVMSQLDAEGHDPERLWGNTLYDTAVALADEFDDPGEIDTAEVLVASGERNNIIDALAGGTFGRLIVLSARDELRPVTGRWLEQHVPYASVTVLGGPLAVDETAYREIEETVC